MKKVNKTKKVLNELINTELEKLRDENLSIEDRREIEQNILTLMKINNESDENKNDKTLQYVKLGVEVASVVLPLAFYGVWMNKGLEFEKTGTFTSNTFKGLTQKFKPTK